MKQKISASLTLILEKYKSFFSLNASVDRPVFPDFPNSHFADKYFRRMFLNFFGHGIVNMDAKNTPCVSIHLENNKMLVDK